MSLGEALAAYVLMQPHQQAVVDIVFEGIKSAFPNVRDAFVEAVEDELLTVKTEMLLLGRDETMVMQ